LYNIFFFKSSISYWNGWFLWIIIRFTIPIKIIFCFELYIQNTVVKTKNWEFQKIFWKQNVKCVITFYRADARFPEADTWFPEAGTRFPWASIWFPRNISHWILCPASFVCENILGTYGRVHGFHGRAHGFHGWGYGFLERSSRNWLYSLPNNHWSLFEHRIVFWKTFHVHIGYKYVVKKSKNAKKWKFSKIFKKKWIEARGFLLKLRLVS